MMLQLTNKTIWKVKVAFCLHFAFRSMAENYEFPNEYIFVREIVILSHFSYISKPQIVTLFQEKETAFIQQKL